MSRKDPRRALLVPLDAKGVAALRAIARGGSLGDAVRRVAERHSGPVRAAPVAPLRRLPVQLPRALLARIEASAAAAGRTPADLLAGMVAAAGRSGPPEVR
ncbi:hypothetical protein OCH239_09440 [Roseivivax halodurans JCM 10272]|uniref:Uncharacterized protein n=1 Tax=Roseivivax halodurans JCM 10272 TaxID=1449350 RepID=X7EBW4_9RHOB|nr:hypothetical protein [Roseivivax halodurans]ETX13584.1 hypothetical protein OCH239_09440 [Roseivivax halodurans JCM 10272]